MQTHTLSNGSVLTITETKDEYRASFEMNGKTFAKRVPRTRTGKPGLVSRVLVENAEQTIKNAELAN